VRPLDYDFIGLDEDSRAKTGKLDCWLSRFAHILTLTMKTLSLRRATIFICSCYVSISGTQGIGHIIYTLYVRVGNQL